MRVSKTVSSTTTNYTWDPTGIGQVISDGNDYVWGLGLISQIASGTPTYAHSDGLGSTQLLTHSSGTVVGTQQYDAFGATRSQSGTQLPFTYTGEQIDPESGLVYLRNRYLDPLTGRFLTPDPLGFFGSGVNLYAYTQNSPIIGTDPSGLVDPFGAGGGEYGGGFGGLVEVGDSAGGSSVEMPESSASNNSSVAGTEQICPYVPEAGSDTGNVVGQNSSESSAANGESGQRFYRGARGDEDPDFTPNSRDYKLTKAGTVKSTHGVSVFDNPDSVANRGFTPHEIDQSSVPDE